MIKAILLDIDGILIGDKEDYNFPSAHPIVLKTLQTIRESGIPIILCTAKPNFSIADIIQDAHLNNFHITDGGAVIIDPIDDHVLEELTLDTNLIGKIVQMLLDKNIYTELYTHNHYYIQNDQIAPETYIHQAILQKEAVIVNSLIEAAQSLSVTKIMFIAKDNDDKEKISQLIAPFTSFASINWGLHPTALPRQFEFIVNKETSKKDAVLRVLEALTIPIENALGIGDSTSDWKFIQPLGYGATLQNGTEEIKNLIQSKQNGHFFIGKSVDENGVIDIFKYFNLL